jgi:SAM-dependent methyltransferase
MLNAPFFRLHRRDRNSELMDQPALLDAEHRRALAGLRAIHVVSRSSAILWLPVRRLAAELGVRSLRVLDWACGGGDVAVGRARKSRRAGIHIALVGCDRSPRALEVARAGRASRRECGVH